MSWHDPGTKEISLAILCFAAAILVGAYKTIVWLLP